MKLLPVCDTLYATPLKYVNMHSKLSDEKELGVHCSLESESNMILVDRMEEMLGSYAPGQNNEKKFPLEEAPSGMLARGKYEARSKFTDDDGHSYLDFDWSFEVFPLLVLSNIQ
jgi:Rho GDP-dissociation inhibitor